MSVSKNTNFSHDLAFGELKESELADILTGKTLELKSDRYKNGRHAIELKKVVKGEVKPSGLSATEADWYCLGKSNSYMMFKTSDLKAIVDSIYQDEYDLGKPNKDTGLLIIKGRLEMMGDGFRSYCMLVEESEIIKGLERLRKGDIEEVV